MNARARLVLIGLAAAVAGVATGGSAPAQPGPIEGLGSRVAQLGDELRQTRRRLGRTRAGLRRQTARLARVERRLALLGDDREPGLRSPDGRFSVNVSDAGIVLRAPGATLSVDAAALTLTSGAGSRLEVSAGRTTLASPVISLGGGADCPPVVRRSDPLLVDRETLQATFAASSLRVLAC